MRLIGKTAIITGGANGIGLAACERFAEEGANVIMADFDEIAGKEQEALLKSKGFDVTFLQVDVVRPRKCCTISRTNNRTYGKIDILINNAGITRDATLLKWTQQIFNMFLMSI